MTPLLFGAIVFAQACFALSMGLALVRLLRGPSAQDRVLAIRYRSSMYFEAALLIAVFGFIGSAATGKFLLRGEVIE